MAQMLMDEDPFPAEEEPSKTEEVLEEETEEEAPAKIVQVVKETEELPDTILQDAAPVQST